MSLRPDLRRKRAWEPLVEVMDAPTWGPFTAAAIPTPRFDPSAVGDQLRLECMEWDLRRRGTRRQERARHAARCWAWHHRSDVGPLLDSPGAHQRVAWGALCHLKHTPEQRARAWMLVERQTAGEQDEDVRQEALIHLFVHVLSDRYPGWREGYLKTAVRNLRRDMARKRAAEVHELADDEALVRACDAAAVFPDPADVTIESMAVETLVDVVTRLRPVLAARETQVLSMRLDGHDDPEIARTLGTTTATINSHGRRIAAKARRLSV